MKRTDAQPWFKIRSYSYSQLCLLDNNIFRLLDNLILYCTLFMSFWWCHFLLRLLVYNIGVSLMLRADQIPQVRAEPGVWGLQKAVQWEILWNLQGSVSLHWKIILPSLSHDFPMFTFKTMQFVFKILLLQLKKT